MKATIPVFLAMPKAVGDERILRKEVVKEGMLNALPRACPEIIGEKLRGKGKGTHIVIYEIFLKGSNIAAGKKK